MPSISRHTTLFSAQNVGQYTQHHPQSSSSSHCPSSTARSQYAEGVKICHPHSNHIWTDPESSIVRRGMSLGVPLEIKLEGRGAYRFLLRVGRCNDPPGAQEDGLNEHCREERVRRVTKQESKSLHMFLLLLLLLVFFYLFFFLFFFFFLRPYLVPCA